MEENRLKQLIVEELVYVSRNPLKLRHNLGSERDLKTLTFSLFNAYNTDNCNTSYNWSEGTIARTQNHFLYIYASAFYMSF